MLAGLTAWPAPACIYTFIAEFAKNYHYDYFDRHDLMPFFAELRHTAHILSRNNHVPRRENSRA